MSDDCFEEASRTTIFHSVRRLNLGFFSRKVHSNIFTSVQYVILCILTKINLSVYLFFAGDH